MHLLEASLALWQATGRARWKDLVVEIAALCRVRFIDSRSGALLEHFADDWSRLPGEAGAQVEPGHCFEWAWLFERIGLLGVGDGIAPSDSLVGFARRFGIADGVAVNAIDIEGRIRGGDARLWPQTERLKAALVRYRRTGSANEKSEALRAVQSLWRYFETPLAGSWYDVLKPDGTFVDQPAPASSFYHIVCALSELIGTTDAG